MGNPTRLAVLGAGHGGLAYASDLSLRGYEVRLFNRSFERIRAIQEEGGIETTGVIGGFAKLGTVTTNMKDAIQDADVILVVVPAFAHEYMFEKCVPILEEGQVVVISPDNFGSLELANILGERRKELTIGGLASIMYACRRTNSNEVGIYGKKKVLPFAAFPATDTKRAIRVLKDPFPQFIPAANVIETGLNNLNAVFHPAMALLNAGRIESTKGDFLFYRDGATESVVRVMDSVDKEKMAIAKALGLEQVSAREWMHRFYGVEEKSLYETLQKNRPYDNISAPRSLEQRYVKEDVPYGLVPISSIADLIRVRTPCMTALIHLASSMNQEDYLSTGRNVEKMGLSGKNPTQISEFVTEGKA